MGGRAAMLLVLGFSVIFLTIGFNFNSLTNSSVENAMDYFDETQAYNLAVSGANLAANQIFLDKSWTTGYQNISLGGGRINVYIGNNYSSTGSLVTSGKTIICHVPPGNPDKAQTLSVGNSAVAAHLAHGDYLGECNSDTYSEEIATIFSEGTFNGVTKVIVVKLKPSTFAKFGNYYSSMTAYPATGDTFAGPFHVNSSLTTYGRPVFLGKVTCKGGLIKKGSPPKPIFNAGIQEGIDNPLQVDFSNAQTNADYVFKASSSSKGIDVRLYFNENGTVTYSTKQQGSSTWSAETTKAISTLAPNGILYADKGNFYIKGTLDGRVTLYAAKNGKTGYGNIYFEDNMVYKDNPEIESDDDDDEDHESDDDGEDEDHESDDDGEDEDHESDDDGEHHSHHVSDDMLGLVAEENIRIQYNSNTVGKDIYTQATMFALNGNVGPEDGLVTQSALKSWKILGGITAKNTRVTATYSGSNPVKGLKFVHTFDERFYTSEPPLFPHTKNFEVVSWYE